MRYGAANPILLKDSGSQTWGLYWLDVVSDARDEPAISFRHYLSLGVLSDSYVNDIFSAPMSYFTNRLSPWGFHVLIPNGAGRGALVNQPLNDYPPVTPIYQGPPDTAMPIASTYEVIVYFSVDSNLDAGNPGWALPGDGACSQSACILIEQSSVEEVDEPTELIERSVQIMNALRGDG